jgi:hypothetical protein
MRSNIRCMPAFNGTSALGCGEEEARLPTPEHLRKAYDELLHAIENDRTPSPSPSPQATAIAAAQSPQSADSIAEHPRPKPRTKDFIPQSNAASTNTWLISYSHYKMPLIMTARFQLPNKHRRGGCLRAGSK